MSHARLCCAYVVSCASHQRSLIIIIEGETKQKNKKKGNNKRAGFSSFAEAFCIPLDDVRHWCNHDFWNPKEPTGFDNTQLH